MGKKLVYFLLLLFIVSCSNSPNEQNAEFVRVVDGDTLIANIDGTQEYVRLLLVDTPETKHPDVDVQPFGQEASNLMKVTFSPSESIIIEYGAEKRDKYDRLLAYVYTKDKQMFNKMLLEKGLARVAYVYPPNDKYVDDFRDIEEQAKNNKIGIWSVDGYATQEDGFHPEVVVEENESSSKQDGSNGKGSPLQNCDIKGNINSNGEKIYHTPDSLWYEQTKPEIWFCNEKEATENGFRSAKY
ncbi:thermonuclease family protein [Virgibacillus byunsanensis]|uniref:Thermonuclease family protein n=1 Tax=Virgibacillus byunsanensis TaxID=570945 RepID=A0ABW3LKY8_9BACI